MSSKDPLLRLYVTRCKILLFVHNLVTKLQYDFDSTEFNILTAQSLETNTYLTD